MTTDGRAADASGRRALRARALGAALLGALVGLGLGLAAWVWLPLSAAFIGKALLVFVVVMVVAVAGVVAHHPHRHFGRANQVTTLRVVLVAGLAGLLGEPSTLAVGMTAVVVATLVAVLDGIDGRLARRDLQSAFGARFDMETDALFVLVLSVLVWQHERAGAWILVGGLLRYGFVAAGWTFSWMAAPLLPTWRAKAVTVCHLVGLIVALAPIVPTWLGQPAVAVSLLLLIWSFLVDVGRLWRGTGMVGGNG